MLLLISGPSGSGKTTIVNYIIEKHADVCESLVTTSSRKPRKGEVEGNPYYFISLKEYKEKIKNGEFFEYNQVYGNYYGVTNAELAKTQNDKKCFLGISDVDTVHVYKERFSKDDLITVYLSPSPAVLKQRLIDRGDDMKDIERRIACIEYEESQATPKLYDYIFKDLGADDSKVVGDKIFRLIKKHLKK